MDKKLLPAVIVSQRLSLKLLTPDLAQTMFEYIDKDRERLSQFLPWPKFILKVEDEIEFIKSCQISYEKFETAVYGLFHNDDNKYLGNISVHAISWTNESCEIGYWILGQFEGFGYMAEAVKILNEELFNFGFNRIVIRFDPLNNRSGRIPKKLNFSDEGLFRQAIKIDGAFRDLKVFSKIKSDL